MEHTKPVYRNVIRSKTLIRNAFIQLLRAKKLHKIKAKDVIDLADVSKGTFYAHYGSIYDIYQEIENEYLELLFQVFKNRTSPVTLDDLSPLFLSGLEEIQREKDIYLILFQSSYGVSFLDKIKQTFLNYMLSGCEAYKTPINRERAQGFFTFAAGGVLTLIREWMDDPDQMPPKQFAVFLNRCIIQGIYLLNASSTDDTSLC